MARPSCGCPAAATSLRPGRRAIPRGSGREQRAESLLARLPTLLKAARTPGALAQPAVRQRTEDAAEALAERRRWPDLLALTDSLSGEPASLPPSLVRLRVRRPAQLGRDAEARDLLILLAKGNTATGGPTPRPSMSSPTCSPTRGTSTPP